MTTPLDDKGREALDHLLSIGVTPAEYRRVWDHYRRLEVTHRIGDVLIEVDLDGDRVTLIHDPGPFEMGTRWTGTFAEALDMLWGAVVMRHRPANAADIARYLKGLRAAQEGNDD